MQSRKRNRLEGYNYSTDGSYFITLCVKERKELLGSVVGAITNRPDASVELSEYGKITDNAINEIPAHYENVSIDKYVIMPNHIHLIITLCNGRLVIAPTNVSFIIQQLKRNISKQIGLSIWQKSFHDHIIRNEAEYQLIWAYIDKNPELWNDDVYHV
ncbi:MAG: hypothetical protein FWH33_05135 [Oscillospiraceae bacterium]|nr:hypothetical protein [Oscillospiraceae bacterium]